MNFATSAQPAWAHGRGDSVAAVHRAASQGMSDTPRGAPSPGALNVRKIWKRGDVAMWENMKIMENALKFDEDLNCSDDFPMFHKLSNVF